MWVEWLKQIQDGYQDTKVAMSRILEQLWRLFCYLRVYFPGHGIQLCGLQIDFRVEGFEKSKISAKMGIKKQK